MRTVVLLCGPPGAGKTTAARASGLGVYDRDDPRWQGERDFVAALEQLGEQPHARAVVIRSGASSIARRRWARTIGATHVYVVLAPRDVLAGRVHHRGRADRTQSLAALNTWFDRFDTDDDVQAFPGWPAVFTPDLGLTSDTW